MWHFEWWIANKYSDGKVNKSEWQRRWEASIGIITFITVLLLGDRQD